MTMLTHFDRLTAYLLGVTTSYRLNAYDDVRVSDQLVDYVNTGHIPAGDDSVSQRTRRLVNQTPGINHRQRVILQAYTELHINAAGDIMMPRFIEERLGLPVLVPSDLCAVHECGPVNFLFWGHLWNWNLGPLQSFSLERTGVVLALTKEQVIEEFLRVQAENTAVNSETHRSFEDGPSAENPKVATLLDVSQGMCHQKVFLKGAANTQQAATRWDHFFEWCLSWRHGSSSMIRFEPKSSSFCD